MEVYGQFHARPLYPHGKKPWYPFDRRLGGSQSRSGRGGEEKNSQPQPGLEPPIIQPVAPALYHWAMPAHLVKQSVNICNTDAILREECLRIGYWGEYLDLKGNKWQKAWEDCIMRGFIRVIKWRIMRWVGYVARMGEMRDLMFLFETLNWRYHLEGISVHGRIILEYILRY
jgi:hypothetical protein